MEALSWETAISGRATMEKQTWKNFVIVMTETCLPNWIFDASKTLLSIPLNLTPNFLPQQSPFWEIFRSIEALKRNMGQALNCIQRLLSMNYPKAARMDLMTIIGFCRVYMGLQKPNRAMENLMQSKKLETLVVAFCCPHPAYPNENLKEFL